jgi:hypothetical protein
LKGEVILCAHIALVVDEWIDGSLRRYVGLKVHCSNEQRYASFCLEHWPLTGPADARSLEECVHHVLNKYDVDEKVRFIITDKTRIMLGMVKEKGKNWSPCWEHIYDLMLSIIVDALRSECLDELFQFTAAAALNSLEEIRQ